MHSATTPTPTLAIIVKVRRFIDNAFRELSFPGFLRPQMSKNIGVPWAEPSVI